MPCCASLLGPRHLRVIRLHLLLHPLSHRQTAFMHPNSDARVPKTTFMRSFNPGSILDPGSLRSRTRTNLANLRSRANAKHCNGLAASLAEPSGRVCSVWSLDSSLERSTANTAGHHNLSLGPEGVYAIMQNSILRAVALSPLAGDD